MRTPDMIALERKVQYLQHTLDRLSGRITDLDQSMKTKKGTKKNEPAEQ